MSIIFWGKNKKVYLKIVRSGPSYPEPGIKSSVQEELSGVHLFADIGLHDINAIEEGAGMPGVGCFGLEGK